MKSERLFYRLEFELMKICEFCNNKPAVGFFFDPETTNEVAACADCAGNQMASVQCSDSHPTFPKRSRDVRGDLEFVLHLRKVAGKNNVLRYDPTLEPWGAIVYSDGTLYLGTEAFSSYSAYCSRLN